MGKTARNQLLTISSLNDFHVVLLEFLWFFASSSLVNCTRLPLFSPSSLHLKLEETRSDCFLVFISPKEANGEEKRKEERNSWIFFQLVFYSWIVRSCFKTSIGSESHCGCQTKYPSRQTIMFRMVLAQLIYWCAGAFLESKQMTILQRTTNDKLIPLCFELETAVECMWSCSWVLSSSFCWLPFSVCLANK